MVSDELHIIVLSRAVAELHGDGGLERHVSDLVRHVLRQGAHVTLITRQPSNGNAVKSLGHERLTVRIVPYRTFPFAGQRGTTAIDRSSSYLYFGWRAGRLAAEIVRRGGIHIVHGMGAASLGYASARQSDWLGTVPFVFNPHGMEEFGSTGPGLGMLKSLAYAPLRKAVRACARAADRVVATDRVLVSTVMKHLDVDGARISVVPNAVDLEAIAHLTDAAAARGIRERLGLSAGDVLLVGVGRLEENKGFQYLIGALAQRAAKEAGQTSVITPKWRCVVLGHGPARAGLERDIAAAGLGDRILLPGRVDETELHAWYEAANVFVHPTVYEGSSIVTLEAMAHRRAIVATAAGGLPDKVRPGVNGWLVAPGDSSELSRAIEEALSRVDRSVAMGQESRAIVEREFSWNAVLARLFELYGEVLSGRNRRASAPGS